MTSGLTAVNFAKDIQRLDSYKDNYNMSMAFEDFGPEYGSRDISTGDNYVGNDKTPTRVSFIGVNNYRNPAPNPVPVTRREYFTANEGTKVTYCPSDREFLYGDKILELPLEYIRNVVTLNAIKQYNQCVYFTTPCRFTCGSTEYVIGTAEIQVQLPPPQPTVKAKEEEIITLEQALEAQKRYQSIAETHDPKSSLPPPLPFKYMKVLLAHGLPEE